MLTFIARLVLGSAAQAGHLILDQDARLAMPPRVLGTDARRAAKFGTSQKNLSPPPSTGLKLITGGRRDAPAAKPPNPPQGGLKARHPQ